MSKVKLHLDAELDLLNKDELKNELHAASAWEREAAFGLRHQNLPIGRATVDGTGNLAMGGDQADQTIIGPKSGMYWAVKRVSVDGLESPDQVKLYKGSTFVGWIAYQPGFVTFGKDGLVLKPGDFLRLTGSGMTSGLKVVMTGEAVSVPGPLMWKLLV